MHHFKLQFLPEEADLLPEHAETVTVNVYRRDGKTQIDTATLRKGS